MAEIVGCLAMSHAPQLLTPPEKWPELPDRVRGPFNPKPDIQTALTPEMMKSNAARCDAAIAVLRQKLEAWAPDTVIICGDDQHENMLDDNMPPFTLFVGEEVDATRKYRYFGTKDGNQVTRYKANGALASEVLQGLMGRGFDPSWSRETRFEGGLGHAFGRVLEFLCPNVKPAIVPVMVNTYYPPAPNAKRCADFGRALGALAVASDKAERVVFIGSGGLSHTKIDESLDQDFIAALGASDIGFMETLADETLVAGTSEIRNWIIIAAAAGAGGTMVDYVPCYRNEKGVGCAMGFAYWDRAAA